MLRKKKFPKMFYRQEKSLKGINLQALSIITSRRRAYYGGMEEITTPLVCEPCMYRGMATFVGS